MQDVHKLSFFSLMSIEVALVGLAELRDYAAKHGEPEQISGRQESRENLLNQYMVR